ncbi:MAG TPA: DUF6279 family lipoprotein [Ideonella sp.]|nr:DUF6279 family lipoprotein [Ideonella sp.]
MPKLLVNRAGKAGGQRPIIVALACAAVLLVAGCSALKLSYGHGSDLSYWWADKYVDFDDAQAPQVRAALDQWFAWHRTSQLPDYAQQLVRAQAEVQQPVSAEQACRWYGLLQARADTAFAQAVPAMARLALEVKPGQLQHMAKRFDKLNAEYRDDVLEETPPEQHKIAVKKLRERYEMLFGSLDRPQRAALDAAVAGLPVTPVLWDAERRQRQQALLATLKRLVAEKASPEQAQAALQALYEQAKHSPRPAYAAAQQQMAQAHCALFAQIHTLSSPGQRREAAKKLRGWEDDARTLAAAASPQAVAKVAQLSLPWAAPLWD